MSWLTAILSPVMMLKPVHPQRFCSVGLICRVIHQVKLIICAVLTASLQSCDIGLMAGGPTCSPALKLGRTNYICAMLLFLCVGIVVAGVGAPTLCIIGWITLPFTRWDVPLPLSVSSGRSILSNANVVGTPG